MGGRGAAFNAAAQKVREAVQKAENGIRNRKTEKAVLVDGNGNVLFERTDNKKSFVGFSYSQVLMMADGYLTHNHPRGTTFSPQDIDVAISGGLREIRACHKNGFYSLRREFDINGIPPANYDRFSSDYEQAYTDYQTNTTDKIWNASQQTQADADRCNQMIADFRRDWLKKNAKTYGWKYTEGGL